MSSRAKTEAGNQERTVKVVFNLDPDSWHAHSSESLWAQATGDGTYRLENVPFFVKGVSYHDVVRAARNENGELGFLDVQSRGGYSTCRVVITSADHDRRDSATKALAALEDLGCELERAEMGEALIFAVSIPPQCSIDAVFDVLEAGERDDMWKWETGFDGHPQPA